MDHARASTNLATKRFSDKRREHVLAEAILAFPKFQAALALPRDVLGISAQAAKAAVPGELTAGRLLYVLDVSKFWVNRNEELRERIVELPREEPFMERGKEWIRDLPRMSIK